jgi:CDP-6-deoxy-D-xylo-4-hexulose-3-dehydrase
MPNGKNDHIDFLSNFAFPIICRTVKIRDELVAACTNKIEIRPIVGGNMSEQPFFKKYVKPNKLRSFKNPNATFAHRQGLYFGNNPELTNSEVKTIIKIFS